MEPFSIVSHASAPFPRPHRTSRRAELRRRAISLPLAFFGLPLLTIVAPLAVVVCLALDLVTAPRRTPLLRLFGALYVYAALTFTAQIAALWIWARSGFGARNWHPTTQARWRRLIGWWVVHLHQWLGRVVGYRVDVTGAEHLRSGPLLVLSRHESIFDALLPVALAVENNRMGARLVLMRELRNDPNFDLVAHRSPHHFVARGGDDPQAEIDRIGRLAEQLPHDTAGVIYPEGRLSRPHVRRRIIDRLEGADPIAAARARELEHLLPIRPGGVAALLDRAPEGTHVAFVAHVGYRRLTDPRTIWRSIPLRDPIEVEVFREPVLAVPPTEEERIDWLHEQWRRVDRWVAARHS